MAHRYGQLIAVTCDQDGTPTSLTWREQTYRVVDVLSTWHLQDRWWVSHAETLAPSDRQYYRLLLPNHQVFEVYHDHEQQVWVLDVVQD